MAEASVDECAALLAAMVVADATWLKLMAKAMAAVMERNEALARERDELKHDIARHMSAVASEAEARVEAEDKLSAARQERNNQPKTVSFEFHGNGYTMYVDGEFAASAGNIPDGYLLKMAIGSLEYYAKSHHPIFKQVDQ